MITLTAPKRARKQRNDHNGRQRTSNLYRFIRLILGPDIANRRIAMRWNMDQKNFHGFSSGRNPVPRLEKLIQLAQVLGINKYMVLAVAAGAPANRVYKLIRDKNLPGQIKLIFGTKSY